MKKAIKLLGEVLNVMVRHSWLFVSGMTMGMLMMLGVIKVIEIIIKTF
jgi:hypothetical protein